MAAVVVAAQPAAVPAAALEPASTRLQPRAPIAAADQGANRAGNANQGANRAGNANQAANRNANANQNVNRNANVNNNVNRNTNVNNNVNVNRNVNVNVNGKTTAVAEAITAEEAAATIPSPGPLAVTAAVAVTAAAIGSIVNQPPAGCATQIVNGLAYQNCNGTWYQPQISGSSTTYIVVNAP